MSNDWTGKLLLSVTINFGLIMGVALLVAALYVEVKKNTEFREKMQTWEIRK